MDIRPLEHFLALAETLHFGRASDSCHVSPSTLSRSIGQLKQRLGVTLFDRDNRHVALTHQGRRFQQFARETLEQWEQLRQSMMSEAQALAGEISIYCSVTASYSFLYELLSEFRRRHSRIKLKLHTGDPADAMSRVLAGSEDMAITPRPRHPPEALAFKSLTRSPLVFIAPRGTQDWYSAHARVAFRRAVARGTHDPVRGGTLPGVQQHLVQGTGHHTANLCPGGGA